MQFTQKPDGIYQVVGDQLIRIDDGDNYTIAPDGAALIPVPHHRISKLEFRNRFTTEELIAIDNYATNTTLTADQKAAIATILKNFDCASEIDLCDKRTVAAVEYLETVGLIAPGRAQEVPFVG